ncbi:MAG TPA: T9SS type A sorting domain-containing protein, partial [Bacteroidia bacterium]|nr:T9SS type A sorting domain-containing protein [Bacteroidia bacterium]
EGKVTFYIQSMNGQNVFMQLFDGNGTTFLGGSYTSSNATFNVDGLAAGTYYFRIKTYYNSEYVPYRFSVKLTTPTYLIDTEPNGTKATAKNITKNDSITGHIGYYYNNLRDTFDYRKLTITEYGSLTFKVYSGNGQNVYAQLFDADGTTYLAGSYTSSTAQWTRNDMAPGTYYLRIHTYYVNSEFVPYSLKLTFTPVVATDLEPNATMATATTLNVNTPTNGCFGYYNNGVRDTNDWFKVTMPEDGKAIFSLGYAVAVTGNYFLEVYDAQGVIRHSQYASGATLTFTKADIRKGTYYVRVHGYYNHEYSQYLLNVTFTSTNPTDAETNNTASTAKHIAGYAVRNGNIGYNAFGTATDTVDWHRMGHWGVGPMNLIIKKVANPDGVMPSINFKLYGDTTAAPLYNFDLTADSTNVSYTLAKKVYYIKLTKLGVTYGGYNITANYRDTCSLVIAVTTHIPDSGCNRGTLVYDITRGVGPYVVQLYKDGVASGAPINTSGTATYNNVDGGVYYITARSSQAVDCDKASSIRAIAGTPLGIQKLQITSTTAVLRWTAQPCVDGFIMAYRIPPSLVFTFDTVPAGKYRDTIFNLTPGTRYRCKIASFVTYDGTTYVGNYSDLFSIITPLRQGDEMIAENENLLVYPNPANDVIQVALPTDNGTLQIANMMGQVVKSVAVSTTFNTQVSVYDLPKGVYLMQYISNNKSYTTRFIKE